MVAHALGRCLWHVSPSENRGSIERYGLDWRRMQTTGVAAPPSPDRVPRPELDAVFLCESLDDVEFFVGFGSHPMVDVWEVDATSLVIEDAPDGWLMCRAAIPAALVRLVQQDRDPTRRPLSAAGLVFVSRMLTIDEMTQLAGVAPDGAGTLGGASLGLESDEPHTWWTLEGRDRYAPLASVVAELFDRVRAHEGGLAVLGEQCDQVTFRAFTQETGAAAPLWEPDAKTRELLDRVHATRLQ